MSVTTAEAVADRDRMLAPLVEPAVTGLAAQLAELPGLCDREAEVICASAATMLRSVAWPRVSRVALLEMHAARLTGQLTAADPAGRWRQWVARLATPTGWTAVTQPYPTLLPRLHTLIANRCAAAVRFARRFTLDRHALPGRLGADPGELRSVQFAAGDSHHAGQTVAIVGGTAGQVIYKPRSLRIDAAIAGLLPRLLPDLPAAHRIRVPPVLCRADQHGEYGWAGYVAHRYCDDDPQFRAFYRGLGHWLAVMRLLGGSDLHSENVVAAGPVPVVVDCETMFTPQRATKQSGYGEAVDLAAERLGGSVLRTGILPGRGATLGWRGVDLSAAGFLPREQTSAMVPAIVNHGTDRARIGTAPAPPPPRHNHPSADPDLGRYWPEVVAGFRELTDHLRQRDRAGRLEPLLAGFADCPVRVLVRDTSVYGELSRMLWHPGALHRPESARDRAAGLLARQADNLPGVPDDPAVIDAELADLLTGDVPVFLTTPRTGRLTGPAGVRWGPSIDLRAATLARWRAADPADDARIIQAALAAAYLNDGWLPPRRRRATAAVRVEDLDRRRRGQAARIMRRLVRTALRGRDATATWVAPVLGPEGWTVRSLAPEMYGGQVGVAVLFAGYLREQAAGRADEVAGVAELFPAVLRTARLADDQLRIGRASAAEAGTLLRPEPVGGYLGLGARIWGWLLLARLGGVNQAEACERAGSLAALVPEAIETEQPPYDLMAGLAGAVVPLLRLAEHGRRQHWQQLAARIGSRLAELAQYRDAGAYWPSPAYPDGLGGLSHGVSGVGWALARLAAATGQAEFAGLAAAAFSWEDALFDPARQGWRDARSATGELASTWCHGSVGIGIYADDLRGHRIGGDRAADLLGRAARASWLAGFGYNHMLCHGDLSTWELLDRAQAAGCPPPGPGGSSARLVARLVTDLEVRGPRTGMAPGVFSPGLLPGQGGVAYQLLRMHPDSDLPSVLLPDPGPAR